MREINAFVMCAIVVNAIVLISYSAHAQVDTSLDMVLVNQSPYPAEPGGNVDLEIEIQNKGIKNSGNIIVEFVGKEPFTLLPGQQNLKSFDNVPAKGSIRTSYKIHVSESAITNTYDMEFRIYFSSVSDNYFIEKVPVSVRGEPKIILEDLTTNPANIQPGDTVTLVAKIKNVGTGAARQLQAEFRTNTSSILPVLAGGTIFLGDVNPGETRFVTFTVNVGTDVEYKTYSSSIALNYLDEAGSKKQDTITAGFPVGGTIFLDIINIEPDYARNTIKIELANKGTTEAKSLEAKLIINNQTVGVDYLSQLKANKQATFNFPMVENGKAELVISYIEPNLRTGSVTKELVLDLNRPQGDNSGGYIILVIVVIVAVYFFMRRRKKKSK